MMFLAAVDGLQELAKAIRIGGLVLVAILVLGLVLLLIKIVVAIIKAVKAVRGRKQ